MDFSKEQLNAVNDRGHNILVSAAAGSGKTSVLTERIVRMITEGGRSIDRLLVVTFTKAAAAEIKSRLSVKLAEAAQKKSGDFGLLRQAAAVSSSHINTNDAFFLDVIRQNFDRVNLPAGFYVMDETESKLLCDETARAVIDEKYRTEEEGSPFYKAAECFITNNSNGNDDTFEQMAAKLHDIFSKYPDPAGYFEKCVHGFDGFIDGKEDFFDTEFGKCLASEIAFCADELIEVCRSACELCTKDPEKDNVRKMFVYYGDFLNGIKNAKTYAEAHEIVAGFSKPVSKVYDEKMKLPKTTVESTVVSFVIPMFSADTDTLREYAKRQSEILAETEKLYIETEKRFAERKREKGAVDFSDLSRLCLSLLTEDDGSPSEIAKGIAAQFDEILIDEYQDTDPVQDRIFEILSSLGPKRFMVGDVKQSIYSFRGASPEIFAKYYKNYTPYDKMSEKPDEEGYCIDLSQNFRSDKVILDTVNFYFDVLMSERFGGIEYDDRAMLRSGFPDGKPTGYGEIMISSGDTGAEVCAEKAAELLNDTSLGYAPSDIAFIFDRKGKMPRYIAELKKRGIPFSSPSVDSPYETAEGRILISVLKAIANPGSDIPLAAAMCSPVFDFTPDEIAKIRFSSSGDAGLYEAVKNYAVKDKKTADFLAKLKKYRNYSLSCGPGRLINRIIRESGLDRSVMAAENGDERYGNLLLIQSAAESYSRKNHRGLSAFLRYVDGISDQKGENKNSGTKAEGVSVTTIHGSKGLEYKVCFLCESGRSLTKNGETSLNSVMFNTKSLGVCLGLKNENGYEKIVTPISAFGAYMRKKETLSEKLRCLYVALTRAKERLYISFDGKVENAKSYCGDWGICNSDSYFEWILKALCRKFGDDALNVSDRNSGRLGNIFNYSVYEKPEDGFPVTQYASRKNRLIPEVNTDFRYAYKGGGVPAKLSVSELIEDDTDVLEMFSRKPKHVPAFIDAQTKKPTAAASYSEIGTAMHGFMQFCDFAKAKADIVAEADRCADLGFITTRQRSLLDTDRLSDFFKAPIYERLAASPRIYRELRFNVKTEGKIYTEADEDEGVETLMQGVIDCFFETDEGKIVLLDFKTDRVNPSDGEEKLRARHTKQLKLYKTAIEKITEKPVAEAYIYSFALSRAISADIN